MAHFSYILVLLSLLYITMTFAETNSNNPDYISEICSKTRNPNLCYQLLESINNLQNQCKVAVGAAQVAGFLAYDEINVLIKQGKNPELKEKYKSCLGYYSSANVDIGTAGQLLNSKNYQLMISKVSSAIAEADACDKSLVQEVGALKQATKTFRDESTALLVIVKRLAGGRI